MREIARVAFLGAVHPAYAIDVAIGWLAIRWTVGPDMPKISAKLRRDWARRDWGQIGMGVMCWLIFAGISFAFMHPWMWGR